MDRAFEMPASNFFESGRTVRPLFENIGVSNYFTIAPEIPPRLMDTLVPDKNFWLILREEVALRH